MIITRFIIKFTYMKSSRRPTSDQSVWCHVEIALCIRCATQKWV